MRTITINTDIIERSDSGAEFIPLGAGDEITIAGKIKEEVRDKINRLLKRPVKGFWGTLGRADNGAINWKGNLEISRYGNDISRGITGSEVDLLKIINPGAVIDGNRIIERFISFDKVELDNLPAEFSEKEIPMLRLTLMLGQDEGALVFYQHTSSYDDTGLDGEIEYIQPQPTEDHNTNQRDRLTYHFPLLPRRRLERTESGRFKLGDSHSERFLVKILTFKRSASSSMEVITNIINRYIPKKHDLLRYDPTSNSFSSVNGAMLDPAVKTLFLVHGTFVDTGRSYKGLVQQWNNKSWLQRVVEQGTYRQIIAFDHPTILDGAVEFKEALHEMLGASFRFGKPVDCISTSGGGPRVKYLANLPLDQSRMVVGKGALVACANGVGYFTTGHNVTKFLTIMRRALANTPQEKVILGLLQLSAEFFLSLPGSRMMTPGHPDLEHILYGKPADPATRYLPVIGDYDISMNDEMMPLGKWVVRGFDQLVKNILGRHHDWVVGTREQYIMPEGFYAYPEFITGIYEPHMEVAGHMSYLKLDKCRNVQNRIFNFLHDLPLQAPSIPPVA